MSRTVLPMKCSGHVEMQNLSASVLDDEEAVQHLKRQCRHGEKVERSDHLPVMLRKVSQLSPGSPRRPTRCRYRATVRSETTKPSFWRSSMDPGRPPGWMYSARRRMSARISAVAFGLPVRACDCHFQKSRKPARCQLTTVSGFTATRASAHRDQMQCRVIQNSRSNRFNRGRGRFRLRRMSCSRKARISRAVSFRLRKKTSTAARRARMNWSMNPSL